MSDYIDRNYAMSHIKRVIVELSSLTIKDIDDGRLFEYAQKEIKKEIDVLMEIYRTGNYETIVTDLLAQEFLQYYGKIYELAEVLVLDIFSEMKNKTLKLKELDEKEKLYYYHHYHYVDNNSEYIKELTESSVQMKELRNSVKGTGDSSSTQRDKIRDMNLKELFEMDEGLRDFLNLNDGGSENYDFDTIRNDTNWTEVESYGSQYHQTYTNDEIYFPKKTVVVKGIPIDMPLGRLLNAKFVNDDGREVVFNPDEKIVTNDVDKGTFNYVNGEWYKSIGSGGHKVYDMDPYDRLMEEKGYKPILRYNKGSETTPNSEHWPKPDEEDEEKK